MRILCIWLPNWPLQRLASVRPELKRRAVVIYEQQRGLKIVACSQAASQRGIAPGMPLAEATSLARLHLEQSNPSADRAALKQLAEDCEQFSPLVGLEDADRPDSLLLDVSGLAPLFGSEELLAEQVARELDRRGLSAHVGIAGTLGAAWAVAHSDPLYVVPVGETLSVLHGLPISALRLPAQTTQRLAKLGIRQIGQLLALPPASLASRFDAILLERLGQATGTVGELITAHRPPPEIMVTHDLEYPIEHRETIELILGQFVERVTIELASRQQGAIQLECRIRCQPGEVRFIIGLFQASAAQQHLYKLVEMRLERMQLPGPVVGLQLAVVVAARLQCRQRELFADQQDHRQELAAFVDRLSSRLQSQGAMRPVLVPDAQPEFAFRYEPLAGGKRRHVKQRSGPPRPLLLESPPAPLELFSVAPNGQPRQFTFRGQQYRIARSWGPERIQTGWWRGRYIRRDYYRVETTGGQRFWLFRSRRDWFLHGIFD